MINDAALIWNLPGRLDRTVQENLLRDEQIFVKLKGTFNEALVCTDRRVMIVKTGFMTGNTFGSDVFQVPYTGITGVQVHTRLLTGYLEISAGGIQNLPKSYWQSGKGAPQRSPNCISLRRNLFPLFGAAMNFIMERMHETGKRGTP